MRKPLAEVPEDHASEEDDTDYQVSLDDSTIVKYAMLEAMETGLRERFGALDAYEMIEGLKEIFAPQVRVMKYQYFGHFISARMEENNSLEEHLDIMRSYHEHLVDLNYGMTESFAIDGVLHSLPPSYKDFVTSYLMRGESFTFHEFLVVLWKAKMEPIDGEGIYLIYML